ncbi:MAG: hypothetical protein B6I19_05115 [Bacteroidetes bacterium 4572_114]|nr:MAG: hypothetical protein B6I19_05115 [Bacteroidetes bacterium 4572_114]
MYPAIYQDITISAKKMLFRHIYYINVIFKFYKLIPKAFGMSLGIVVMVITVDSQQPRTYGVELPGIDFIE